MISTFNESINAYSGMGRANFGSSYGHQRVSSSYQQPAGFSDSNMETTRKPAANQQGGADNAGDHYYGVGAYDAAAPGMDMTRKPAAAAGHSGMSVNPSGPNNGVAVYGQKQVPSFSVGQVVSGADIGESPNENFRVTPDGRLVRL